jgi:2-hydroxy-6-oxonona-2,4-dienedioate hydrolase
MLSRPGALATALLALACGAPADPGRTRPVAVAATPLPQADLALSALGGLRVRYVDVGPTRPDAAGLPLLLIPGHTSRIEEYDGLVPRLAAGRRVLVFDFPGSGYSDKPERRYDLAFYEDAAIAFLDARGVGRAQLAGGSLGGNLVLRLGHRFPERFERLAPWAPASAWRARPWLARVIRAGGYALFWPSVRIQSRYWYSDDWPGREAALADTFAYYDEVMSPGFVAMYFGMAADQVARSLFDLAGEIHQPVWLGWGDRDHGANMGEGVARLHALLPASTLHVFRGARHSLAAEIPDALARELVAFLGP